MAIEVPRRRFSVAEYYRMGEAGIFSSEERVELLDGEVVRMSPIGRRHAGTVDRLTRLFVLRLVERAIVRVQNPIHLDERSEPQPDVSLLRPRADFYTGGHPGPGDVLLVIEVADTSLRVDREVKLGLYARAGIPEAWLIDLTTDTLEISRGPSPAGYTDTVVLERGQGTAPLAFRDLVVRVEDILGEPLSDRPSDSDGSVNGPVPAS